ncbi:MAG: glycosyltransferase, partial [Halieaceae bacterium]|nr:glycosyltransferase [Halieaceae bacterium]
MNTVTNPVIALVLPCYNEEQILPLTARKLASELQRLVD